MMSKPWEVSLVTGPMFSGKSEYMMARVRRAVIAGLKVLYVVPAKDDRRGVGRVVSNAGTDLAACGLEPLVVNEISDLDTRREFVLDHDLVVFDEVQLYNAEDAFDRIMAYGAATRVLVGGLDQDSRNRPFGVVPKLLIYADYTKKLRAVCAVCKSENATRTFRRIPSEAQIVIGGADAYEARCRRCHP